MFRSLCEGRIEFWFFKKCSLGLFIFGTYLGVLGNWEFNFLGLEGMLNSVIIYYCILKFKNRIMIKCGLAYI